MTPSHLIAVAVISLSSIVTAQTQPVGVYIKSPRTTADPRAKLVKDLRAYLGKSAKMEVRIVDSSEAAQLVIDVARPYTTGTPVPYVISGAGDDRGTAAVLYVVGARVCATGVAVQMCSGLSASAKLNVMATLQLGEKIKRLARETAAPQE
jgi:hypothetical protein